LLGVPAGYRHPRWGLGAPPSALPVTRTAYLEQQVEVAADPAARVAALVRLVLWCADAEPARAVVFAPPAIEAAERLGDPVLLSRARYADAVARIFGMKDLVGPYHRLRELGRRFDTLGLPADAAWCEHMAGVALEYLGDPGGATVRVERALAVFRRLGHLHGEARCLNTLGFGETVLGRYPEALERFRRSVELARVAGCAGTYALARMNGAEVASDLGRIAAGEGRTEAARALFEQADAEYAGLEGLVERLGHRHLQPLVPAYRASTLHQLGRHAEALDACHRAVRFAAVAHSPEAQASAHCYAGEVHLALGEPERARELLVSALGSYEHWGLHFETARVLRALVHANEELGRIPEAYALHKRLLAAELALRDSNGQRENEVIAARLEADRRAEGERGDRLHPAELLRQNDRLEAERRALERLAHTDPLTGLANRRHYDAQLSRLVVRAELSGRGLGLVLVDIDRFKDVNDRLSHLTGDTLLCRVAEVVGRYAEGRALAARVGGEEFALLLPGTAVGQAVAVAEELRGEVEKLPLDDLEIGLRVTLSAGVAVIGAGEPAGTLQAAADAALYAAKRQGRNRVCAAPEPSATIR
jgi:diguanylate cyclase (GGDEF)-like protein